MANNNLCLYGYHPNCQKIKLIMTSVQTLKYQKGQIIFPCRSYWYDK